MAYEAKKSIAAADVDRHETAKLLSRYFRIRAILPQLQGRIEEMVQDMEQSEYWLGQMLQTSVEQRAEYRALRYACYESRVKEAMVAGDFELAEKRARRAIACEPGDGRLFMHLGQIFVEKEDYLNASDAYCKSILLNPIGAEVGLFMMGQCYEAMGEYWPAFRCYRHSLLVDPLSVSAREGALRLAKRLRVPMDEDDLGRGEGAVEARASSGLNAYQLYSGMLGR